MAVTSLLELRILPDRLDDAPRLLHDILEGTRAFAGNVSIEVSRDVDDPAHWMVVERWESIEADDAYRAWRASPDGAAPLGELLAAPPTLTRFEDDAAI
jgi:heme oxygenase (mycobilin-producing)